MVHEFRGTNFWDILYMPTTRQWEIQNFDVSDASTLFFDFLSVQNTVRVIEGKSILKRSEGEQNNLLPASGRFELPRLKLQ